MLFARNSKLKLALATAIALPAATTCAFDQRLMSSQADSFNVEACFMLPSQRPLSLVASLLFRWATDKTVAMANSVKCSAAVLLVRPGGTPLAPAVAALAHCV